METWKDTAIFSRVALGIPEEGTTEQKQLGSDECRVSGRGKDQRKDCKYLRLRRGVGGGQQGVTEGNMVKGNRWRDLRRADSYCE